MVATLEELAGVTEVPSLEELAGVAEPEPMPTPQTRIVGDTAYPAVTSEQLALARQAMTEPTPKEQFEAKIPFEPGVARDIIHAGAQVLPQFVGGVEETIGGLGGMVQWGFEQYQISDLLGKWATGKGVGVTIEHLLRKFGPKKLTRMHDKRIATYAKMGEKWADWWEEQANKGWEAPNPEIMQARWRDMPVTKGISVTARAAPNFLVAIAASVLTKNPKVGLMFISATSGGQAYRRQRKAGVGKQMANFVAMGTAAWEYVTEKVPFEYIMRGNKSLLKKLIVAPALESAQEFVQGLGENFLEYFGYTAKDLKSVPAAVREGLNHALDGWVENMVAGFGLGLVGVGAVGRRGIAKPTPTVAVPAPERAVAPITPAEPTKVAPARIRAAAFYNPNTGEIAEGVTHAQAAAKMDITVPEGQKPVREGFVTEDGKFVTNKEAEVIAKKSGQIKKGYKLTQEERILGRPTAQSILAPEAVALQKVSVGGPLAVEARKYKTAEEFVDEMQAEQDHREIIQSIRSIKKEVGEAIGEDASALLKEIHIQEGAPSLINMSWDSMKDFDANTLTTIKRFYNFHAKKRNMPLMIEVHWGDDPDNIFKNMTAIGEEGQVNKGILTKSIKEYMIISDIVEKEVKKPNLKVDTKQLTDFYNQVQAPAPEAVEVETTMSVNELLTIQKAAGQKPKGQSWVDAAKKNLQEGKLPNIRISYDTDTGKPIIVDGNATIQAAKELGIENITAYVEKAKPEAPAEKPAKPVVEGKVFTVAWYRPAGQGEIGPITEYEKITATSKAKAEEWAKSIAKERDWRYVSITEGEFSKKLKEVAVPAPEAKPAVEKKFYTSVPEEWRQHKQLSDWGKKGIRTKGNLKVGKRKTFIWSGEFSQIPTRLPKATMDAFWAKTEEVWYVTNRKRGVENYYLVPKRVIAEVKAELGEEAFKRAPKPIPTPRQVLQYAIQSANIRGVVHSGEVIERTLLDKEIGLSEADLTDNQKRILAEYRRDYEQDRKEVLRDVQERAKEAVLDIEAEERIAIQEEHLADEVGDFLEGIVEPTRPKDLLGRPVLRGGAAGKQAEFLEKEKFRLPEPDIEGQMKIPTEPPVEKPGKAPPGKAGFPKIKEAELPPEAIGKEPISAREIITSLSKALKVPYASMATHRPRRAAGWYEIKPVGIRQINVRDLGTATHEVGHHIDHFWKIRRAGFSKIGRKTWKMPEGVAKGTRVELVKLGKDLYGETKPPGGYASEGVAEFIRGYLTGHIDIKKEAPKFYKWFISDYLPNNPEVADGLLNARGMLTDYRLQGAEARIESQINKKEILGSMKDRVKRANLWFQTMFVDEFAPLRAEMKVAGIERAELKPSEDPYELAVYFSQKEGARARQMVLHGTIDLWGNKTGLGLKEIMKPIADQNAVREFTRWLVAARSLNLWKRGINPGITKGDAQYVYDMYKGNEGWKETAQAITDWNHRVLDYVVESGGIQKEVAARMKELNPIYIPFMRAFAKGEKKFGGGGAGKGLITTQKGVFAIKGSGREIIDPFESMITQTRRLISIAHKHAVATALADIEEKHRGLAGFIWRVPAPKRAMKFQAEQVKKQLMKMGVEFPEAGLKKMDALLTVYSNSPIYLGKERIIAIVRNGKTQWYEVSPEIYRLLQGLDKFYMPRWLNATLGKFGRSVRLGATGINASFGLVKNPIRDALDTIFKGTHARGPLASVKGVAKDLSRLGLAKSLGIEPSKAAQEFVAMGGQISGFIGQDRKSLQHLKGELLASSVGRYSIHTVSHPIDALRQVFGVAESGPRISEYEKALEYAEKKYGKDSPEAKVYAFNKAQDQTINYSRHGVVGKWLNQMIPFWNANAQDISKVHRTFRERGLEATAYALAFLTLPALGLWWFNKDEEWYKELPDYEKANYLHIKIPGKDRILRLPVPFLVGHIFQGLPVSIINSLYRADPTTIKGFLGQVLEGDVYPLVEWPAIVSPIIDIFRNKDWAGRPIVPKSLEGKLPSDQYKEYTTEFCKIIGRIFKVSPIKIEHLINSWSGGLYRRVGRIAELPTKPTEEIQAADWPLIGAIMVRDPYAPRLSIERFYNRSDYLNRAYQSEKISSGEYVERIKSNRARSKLTPLWGKLRETKAVDSRKVLYRKISSIVSEAKKPMTRMQIKTEIIKSVYKQPYKRKNGRIYPAGYPHEGKEERVKMLIKELKKQRK